jgi:hypothetical protein
MNKDLLHHTPKFMSTDWVRDIHAAGDHGVATQLRDVLHERDISMLNKQLSEASGRWEYWHELADYITVWRERYDRCNLIDIPLRARLGVVVFWDRSFQWTPLEQWGYSAQVVTYAEMIPDATSYSTASWTTTRHVQALVDSWESRQARRVANERYDLVVAETPRVVAEQLALAGFRILRCKGDLLQKPLNPDLGVWAKQVLSQEMLGMLETFVLAPARLVLAQARVLPRLRTSSVLPSGSVAAAVARSKWTSIDVLRSVATGQGVSAAQLWLDVPAARSGVAEPSWPEDELGWSLITDPVRLPAVAESVLSSSFVALGNAYLAAFSERLAVDKQFKHIRLELSRRQVRGGIGIVVLLELATPVEAQRLCRW